MLQFVQLVVTVKLIAIATDTEMAVTAPFLTFLELAVLYCTMVTVFNIVQFEIIIFCIAVPGYYT